MSTLTEQFKERVELLGSRVKTTGVPTDHVVFIPTTLIETSRQETDNFILLSRAISANKELNCKVKAEQVSHGVVHGLELTFYLHKDTDFEGILCVV